MLGAGVSLRIHPVPRGPIVNEDFFGLRENPFSLTPNPRYIHRTRHAHETLGRITRGILDRKGLILLTGDVGTGKTTLLYTALHLLDGNPAVQHKIKTAVIVHPTLTREEFLESILDEFDVPCASPRRQVRLESLLKMLLEVRRKGGLAVLVIDEAQMLTGELLQEIRALLELQTGPEKLLQVILCGHAAIEAKIDALNQGRSQSLEVVRCTAKPLTQDETRDYVQHRMRIAGAKSDTIFLQEAVARVHERSGGIPRLVNLLCAQGLSVAASRQVIRVSPRMIDDAAAKICAKAQARVFEPVEEAEPVSAENAGANTAKLTASSTTNTVSARTARRHKRAARRARIAEAVKRAAHVDSQEVAARVRTAEELGQHQAQAAAVAPPAAPASTKLAKAAKKSALAFGRFRSPLLALNARLNRWCSQKFTSKPRGKRLFQIGLAGIALLAVAEVVGELAPAHVVHIAFGFMGMLFIDIALGMGLYLLLIGAGLVGTRPAWAQALLDSWASLTRRSG